MKKAVFIMYPAIGHLHATFNIAKILSRNQIEPIYAGPYYHQPYLENQGFSYYTLTSHPFCVGFEKKNNKESGNRYLDEIIDRLTNRFFLDRSRELATLLQTVNPDYIFLDSFLSTDYIILSQEFAECESLIVFIQTMLSSYRTPHSPPLNVNSILRKRKEINRSWNKYYCLRYMKRMANFVYYLGYDDDSIINKAFFDTTISEKHSLCTDKTFHIGFKNIPEIVVAPTELEFSPEQRLSHQYYVGLSVDLERKEYISDDYSHYVDSLKDLKKKGIKVIYCSFGTLLDNFNDQLETFLRRLLNIIRENKKLYLILSVDREKHFLPKDIPSNIYYSSQIPQLNALSISDLFISHGGLNSIKESIKFSVPLLVYPLDKKWDQMGNSARISFHTLGLTGCIKHDSEKKIILKIREILENPIYKQRISLLCKTANKKYSEKNFMSILRKLENKKMPL